VKNYFQLNTKADLVHTHSEVENVKKELNKLKGDFFHFFHLQTKNN
jgi:hypothetical protein